MLIYLKEQSLNYGLIYINCTVGESFHEPEFMLAVFIFSENISREALMG